MRKAILIIAGLVGLVLSGGPSFAGKKAGVTMADSMELGSQHLVLNGMGLREASWLGVDVYVAGLYVAHPSSDPAALMATNEPKVLVLRFVRNVGRDDITKAWRDGFEKNAVVPLAQLQPQIAQLESWTPAFRKGDTLSFSYVPGHGTTVEVNGTQKGTIPGDAFSRSLFSIWLGTHPPTAALKRGLLGKHGAAAGAG